MQRFEYIAYHNTDEGKKIDDFTLFANIINRTNETVTYERFMKFGDLACGKVTIPISEFEKYYTPLTDEIYEECVKRRIERLRL